MILFQIIGTHFSRIYYTFVFISFADEEAFPIDRKPLPKLNSNSKKKKLKKTNNNISAKNISGSGSTISGSAISGSMISAKNSLIFGPEILSNHENENQISALNQHPPRPLSNASTEDAGALDNNNTPGGLTGASADSAVALAANGSGHPRNRWRCMQPRLCNYCWKTFSNSFNLKQHIVNVHIQSQGVSCSLCDKVVKNKWYLRKHLVTAHGAPLKRVTSKAAAKLENGENNAGPLTNTSTTVQEENNLISGSTISGSAISGSMKNLNEEKNLTNPVNVNNRLSTTC